MSIYIKIGNVANAILLCFVGVWAMITVNSDADALLTVLASAYVITFSLILFSWELKFECCNVCFLKNMGFMFNWAGRCLFFVFVGTLSFGLGLPGVIVGVFTFVNMCWNVFVVCVNPGYFEALREKARRELEQAVKTENARYRKDNIDPVVDKGVGGMAVDIRREEQKLPDVAHNAFGAAGTVGGAATARAASQWVMKTDGQSGEAFWVNQVTGEQRWENPSP
mmetsp:Transcript_39734/g.64662  ORF Transcript_39734/g.64662 Transcript_39734/m.64662 type:complete len:224 (+) Transcript_39734:838-1509(+)